MNKRYCNGMVHVIKQGETLYQLSRKYRVPLALILRANPYVDVYNLQVGQEICIPVMRPFGGMICRPIPNTNTGNPRMMDNRQGQMPDGNGQENEGQEMAEPQMPQTQPQMEPQMEQMCEPASQTCGPEQQMCGTEPRMRESGDVVEQAEPSAEGNMAQEEEVEVYITSGDKSLGDILNEHDVEWEEFVKRNDLGQITVGEDVVLYLPKKQV